MPSTATSQAGGFPVDPWLQRHLKILKQCTDPAMGQPRCRDRQGSRSNPTQKVKLSPGGAEMLPAHPPTPTNSHSFFWLHIPGRGHPWDTGRVTQAFPRVCGVLYIYRERYKKDRSYAWGKRGNSVCQQQQHGGQINFEDIPLPSPSHDFFVFLKKGCSVQHQR